MATKRLPFKDIRNWAVILVSLGFGALFLLPKFLGTSVFGIDLPWGLGTALVLISVLALFAALDFCLMRIVRKEIRQLLQERASA